MSVVYKQRYKSCNLPKTAKSNMFFLNYIATRDGSIYNKNCGFGLWGKMESNTKNPQDINNLTKTMNIISSVSKKHTIYRAILSLDEETAIYKGYHSRKEWELLLNKHIDVIAKENSINLKDFCWMASYHQEAGHPHVHIMFWDSSDNIRTEFMEDKQFEIAMEKIRAGFNRTIFAEELKELRLSQDETKKDLRDKIKEDIEKMRNGIFQIETVNVRFHPKNTSEYFQNQFCEKLNHFVYTLPPDGRLVYQFLTPNQKRELNEISKLIINNTSLKSLYKDFLKDVQAIAETYGNSEEAVKRQLEIQSGRILKDVGNDILVTIKSNNMLKDRTTEQYENLLIGNHHEILILSDSALSKYMINKDFKDVFAHILKNMPNRAAFKSEVLKNPILSEILYKEVTTIINESKELLKAINTSDETTQSYNKSVLCKSIIEITDKSSYKTAYSRIHSQLYEYCEHQKGYSQQLNYENTCGFICAFSKIFRTSNNNQTMNKSNLYKFSKELSKQAKKEKYIEMKNSQGTWLG